MHKHFSRLSSLVKVASCIPKVGSGRLAASVWLKNDMISIGINQLKTHPLQKRFCDNPHKEFLHAETDAIAKASRLLRGDLEGCFLYVARAKRSNRTFVPAMAKSCDGCKSCAHHFGIKGIFYTTDQEEIAFMEC